MTVYVPSLLSVWVQIEASLAWLDLSGAPLVFSPFALVYSYGSCISPYRTPEAILLTKAVVHVLRVVERRGIQEAAESGARDDNQNFELLYIPSAMSGRQTPQRSKG